MARSRIKRLRGLRQRPLCYAEDVKQKTTKRPIEQAHGPNARRRRAAKTLPRPARLSDLAGSITKEEAERMIREIEEVSFPLSKVTEFTTSPS